MRVISQDGTIDMPYEVSSLNMVVGKYEDVVNAAIYCYSSFSTIKMAEYSSEEKAKKAMEMLREEYQKYASQNYMKVFQFPAEEELE